MAVKQIEIEAGHVKRIWLSKYFHPDHNPSGDPRAPVWLVEEEFERGIMGIPVRVRHRGFDFEATGDFRGGTDLTQQAGGVLPRGWVETRGAVVVYYDDGWPEAGTHEGR